MRTVCSIHSKIDVLTEKRQPSSTSTAGYNQDRRVLGRTLAVTIAKATEKNMTMIISSPANLLSIGKKTE